MLIEISNNHQQNKRDFEQKLEKIVDVWNDFIWEYKVCTIDIKFTSDVQTNYFGDILKQFEDTIPIIFYENSSMSITYPYVISYLQSIYIQQDLVEELLWIFKCRVGKYDLKIDDSYSINRSIRNELIGHPIRRDRSGNRDANLNSSSFYRKSISNVGFEYVCYRRENSFNSEIVTVSLVDLQKRHSEFLNKYFDVIIDKLKVILNDFSKKIDVIEMLINNNKRFDVVLKLIGHHFEALLQQNHAYDADSLTLIYSKKENHRRYANFIEMFFRNVLQAISESRESVVKLSEVVNTVKNADVIGEDHKVLVVKPTFKSKSDYSYTLSKLSEMHNRDMFEVHSSVLKNKNLGNDIVLKELSHMATNFGDKSEYYPAFEQLRFELLRIK